MTSLDPSNRPPARREGDGREPPGAGSKVVHHVSDAPRSAVGAFVAETGPSIVISPQAEQPLPRRESKPKRMAEATLVIRDKRRVQELRDGVRRIARRRARQRLGSILLWGGASALAFGFGTAVAFFLAKAGKAASAGGDDPIPPAAEAAEPTRGTLQLVPGDEPRRAVAPARAAATRDPSAPASVPRQAEPAGVEDDAKVVSLSELPDATSSSGTGEKESRGKASSSSEPKVISLEDL